MFKEWLDDPQSLEIVNHYSELANLDLIYLGTKSDTVEITDTKNTQPLLTTLSLLCASRLKIPNISKVIFAGHSVGEFSACALAGFFTFEDAIKLVSTRGFAMAQAASENQATGMAAVLGGDKDTNIKRIKELELVAANVNSDSQIIASGLNSNIDELIANPPAGTKIRKLDVSGAFHSIYMKPAEALLTTEFEKISLNVPKSIFISNKDGNIVSDPQELKSRLVSQISSPVRWDLCQTKFVELGVTGIIELAPAGVLSGIAKRQISNVETFAIKSPQDIELANKFIEKHS
jgi:[acyl-carrier-protein] S-malonyltransferase